MSRSLPELPEDWSESDVVYATTRCIELPPGIEPPSEERLRALLTGAVVPSDRAVIRSKVVVIEVDDDDDDDDGGGHDDDSQAARVAAETAAGTAAGTTRPLAVADLYDQEADHGGQDDDHDGRNGAVTAGPKGVGPPPWDF